MRANIWHGKSLDLESAYRTKREYRNKIRQCRANSIRGTLAMKTHAHAYEYRIWEFESNTNENYNIFLMKLLLEEKDQSEADGIIFR